MILLQRPITKEDIFKHTNDVTIYNTYLEEPLVIGQRINSPFRKDKNPSFGFFKGSVEICWKDFSTGERGDCFEFVRKLHPNFSFFDTLSKIATDLGLPKNQEFFYADMSHIKNTVRELSDEEREFLIAKANTNLQVKFRNWNQYDAEFWQKRGVSYTTLQFYKVKPISHIFVNENIIKADNLAYAFIEEKDNKITYKIYQPFNDKGLKWLSSHDNSIWQGWTQLPKTGDELIITKSLKDVMAIATILKTPAIALQSEHAKPKDKIIYDLGERFDQIYILYDNDYDKEINIGKLRGAYVASRFREYKKGVTQIEIPEFHKSKDFSDLVLNYGADEARYHLSNLLIPF